MHHNHSGRHPGELFVIIWTLLIFAIITADFIFSKPYKLPGEVVSVYIVVLSILAVTRKSKSLYKQKELK